MKGNFITAEKSRIFKFGKLPQTKQVHPFWSLMYSLGDGSFGALRRYVSDFEGHAQTQKKNGGSSVSNLCPSSCGKIESAWRNASAWTVVFVYVKKTLNGF